MNKQLINIGFVLAIALLICLCPMPYGYYTLIRFIAMIVFGCMAFNFYNQNKISLCIIASALALLFQPFAKIALGRDMWAIVDVVVAIGLIILWWRNKNIAR